LTLRWENFDHEIELGQAGKASQGDVDVTIAPRQDAELENPILQAEPDLRRRSNTGQIDHTLARPSDYI
jgi:hypothetical protein